MPHLPPVSAAPATHPLLDFVAAADVFCYMGDLRRVVAAAAAVLRPGGVLVFTVEALGGRKGGGESAGRRDDAEGKDGGADGGGDGHRHGDGDGGKDEGNEGVKDRDGNGFNDDDDDDGDGDGDGYALQGSGRVAHTARHVRRAVAQAGLALVLLQAAVPRWDRGRPVDGYVVVARRRME